MRTAEEIGKQPGPPQQALPATLCPPPPHKVPPQPGRAGGAAAAGQSAGGAVLPAPPRPLRAPPPFRGFCCPLPATAGKCAAAAGPGKGDVLRTLSEGARRVRVGRREHPALHQNRLPRQRPAGRPSSPLSAPQVAELREPHISQATKHPSSAQSKALV